MEREILKLPVIPTRGLVIYPLSTTQYDISSKKTVLALTEAIKNDQRVFMPAVINAVESDEKESNLTKIGTVAEIKQAVRISDSEIRIIVEGQFRAGVISYNENEAFIEASVEKAEISETEDNIKISALIQAVKIAFEKNVLILPPYLRLSEDTVSMIRACEDAGTLCDLVAEYAVVSIAYKIDILNELDVEKRLSTLLEYLNEEFVILNTEHEIGEKVKASMDENQREYYLKERLKAINDELGENMPGDSDLAEELEKYTKAVDKLQLSEENEQKLKKEIQKLSKLPSISQEAGIIRSYLDACLALPWNTSTVDETDIAKIRNKLDSDHYGMKEVKERIIEAIAVKQLCKEKNNQMILCLAGPPGVGKTSIAKSIAEALGKSYARVALGGVHDESEIRGHRRTYLGAMQGRIMHAMTQAKTNNPLILLDEIDKLGNDFRGDPTSALLEVLDSEQNFSFYDHYIDMPFDLSQVLFVTTANNLSAIPAPLRDRMDIIELSSYTSEEKLNIAKKHLIKKQLKKNGLTSKNFKITDSALVDLIENYTRESGVRTLERYIAKIMRKAAVKIVSDEEKNVRVSVKNIEDFLGARKFTKDEMNDKDEVGLATGLAWTAVGGVTLPVEVAVTSGSGKLILTGSLGDVMKESAQAAFTCVRTRADALGIEKDFYKIYDFHIHVPEGATPKDGPSAGITIASAITSALTGRAVRRDIAMTGEITLRGRVLPIGGLKEKSLAAYRLGIRTVIIPKDNVPNLEEIDDTVKNEVKFVPVSTIDEVLDTALCSKKQTGKKHAKKEPKTEVLETRI